MRISDTMRDALAKVKEYGALERRPGGFWTYPGCPVDTRFAHLGAPEWHVTKQTVDALLARGLVREGQRQSNHYGTFLVEVLP